MSISVGPDAIVVEAAAALANEAHSDGLEVLLESFDPIALGSCSAFLAAVGVNDAKLARADAGSFAESEDDNRRRVESMAP